MTDSCLSTSLVLFKTFGRNFKCPCKDQYQRQAGCEQYDEERLGPFGQSKRIADRLNDLQNKPRHDDVRRADTEYIASFQLFQEITHASFSL